MKPFRGRVPEPALECAELRVELPGCMDFVEPVEDAALAVARTRGVSENEAYSLRVALHEALTNAVQHGCAGDPRRSVRLALRVERRHLRISVADGGPGFDPRRLPDPLAEANLARRHGRGIFFMRRFADAVTFSFPPGGGTVVCLRTRLRR